MDERVFHESFIKEQEKITEMINTVVTETINKEVDPTLREFFRKSLDNFLIKGRRRLPIAFINTYYGLTPDSVIIDNFENMYRIATSIELLYAASVIHDDIVDNEDLRGGVPTFHRYFEDLLVNNKSENFSQIKCEEAGSVGRSLAMFGGNILMGIGLSVLNSSDFPDHILSNATSSYLHAYHAINRSQILEENLKLKPLELVSLEEYLMHAQNYRGALYENAVGLASVFSNSRNAQQAKIRDVFNKVGVCAQIVNDIQGSFGHSDGKQDVKDIISGKHTILSIIAYQNGNEEQRKLLKNVLGKCDASEDEISQIKKCYLETGALDFAKMYAANLTHLAQRELTEIYPGLKRDAYEFFILYIEMVSKLDIMTD